MPPLNTKNEIQVIKNHFKKKFITPNATLSIVSNLKYKNENLIIKNVFIYIFISLCLTFMLIV